MTKTVYKYYDHKTATLFEGRREYDTAELSNVPEDVTYIGGTRYSEDEPPINVATEEPIFPRLRRQKAMFGGMAGEIVDQAYVSIVDGEMHSSYCDVKDDSNADLRPVKAIIRM